MKGNSWNSSWIDRTKVWLDYTVQSWILKSFTELRTNSVIDLVFGAYRTLMKVPTVSARWLFSHTPV